MSRLSPLSFVRLMCPWALLLGFGLAALEACAQAPRQAREPRHPGYVIRATPSTPATVTVHEALDDVVVVVPPPPLDIARLSGPGSALIFTVDDPGVLVAAISGLCWQSRCVPMEQVLTLIAQEGQ